MTSTSNKKWDHGLAILYLKPSSRRQGLSLCTCVRHWMKNLWNRMCKAKMSVIEIDFASESLWNEAAILFIFITNESTRRKMPFGRCAWIISFHYHTLWERESCETQLLLRKSAFCIDLSHPKWLHLTKKRKPESFSNLFSKFFEMSRKRLARDSQEKNCKIHIFDRFKVLQVVNYVIHPCMWLTFDAWC